MTAVRSHQDAVFNRTGRVEIPASHIRRHVGIARIQFQGLHRGSWSKSLDEEELAAAILYVDIQSLLLTQRTRIETPIQVFEAAWGGIAVDVPNELTNGDHRVKLQITIALPSDHPQAGRILARSSEIVIVEGPDDGGGPGPSLLKVRPSPDEMQDLSRLEISEPEGPVLYVNAGIPGLSWKELASDPKFKHAIFSNCVREVLRHLIMNPESRSSWGAAWLSLDGIRGNDLPDVDDLSAQEAWREAYDVAETICEHFLEHVELTRRFAEAVAGSVVSQ
jgi:hypothetical protein